MFTGIVTDIGEVVSAEGSEGLRARIKCSEATANTDIGASIACDGACLTVIARGGDWFDAEISAETLSKTNLGGWMQGRRINLERALRVGDELGGHIVSGHVDGLAEIIAITDEGDSTRYRLRAPAELAKYVASKGSVALYGVSLTVNEVEGAEFGVNLIPHTKQVTNWGAAKVGDRINMEIDTLARYVARLAEAG